MKPQLLGLCLGLGLTQLAFGQTILFDNFDSYADQAAFNAVWNAGVTGGGATLSTDQSSSAPKSILQPGIATGYSSGRDITPVWGTDANPLVFSFDFYDSTQAANLRQFASIRDAAPSLVQLVAIGAYSDTTLTKNRYTTASASEADLNTYYAARVAFAPGPNWFILNGPGAPTRTTGWHELKAVFSGTTVEFFVDGVNALSGLTTEYTSTVGGFSFDRVNVGSGLSSANGAGWYDNVLIEIVPEPSTAALALLGGFGLLIARMRRQ
jgi:hypothetical protein